MASRIFQPYRAIGYVTGSLPFCLQARGSEYFLTIALDRVFQIYDVNKMRLKFVSQPIPAPSGVSITAVAVTGDYTFVAYASSIAKYYRSKLVSVLKDEDEQGEVESTIQSLVIFGDFLLAVHESSIVRVWRLASLPLSSAAETSGKDRVGSRAKDELYTSLEFGGAEQFAVTQLLHPSTYLNKILVGSNQGQLQLWNIRSNRMIYQFKPFPAPITCLVQSPVVDVMAVGLLDGTVVLLNCRTDQRLMQFHQDGRVTAISFRADSSVGSTVDKDDDDDKDGDGAHLMATANMAGDVAFWSLTNRRLVHVLKNAHDGCVTAMQFLPGNPVLITSGSDNAIKQWIFDDDSTTKAASSGGGGLVATVQSESGSGSFLPAPRLLRQRSGHQSPPTLVRFYDGLGHQLLSGGGQDRSLRFFSTLRDEQNVEISQGQLGRLAKKQQRASRLDQLRLPQTVRLSASQSKQREWDNLLTCHLNDPVARCWSVERKSIGKHEFKSLDKSNVKSVFVSACGNFGFIGCSSGRIDMFNMQSGLHRRHFGEQADGHRKAVTALASDNTNRRLISCSLDQTVKIWDLSMGKCLQTFPLDSPATGMQLQQESDLVAISCDDLSIFIIDIDTRKIVRQFSGHTNRIMDMAFSPDGRWLVSCALDGTIRTWDLPSGFMVDIFRTDSLTSSLTFSPTGDYLASTHVGSQGIHLWANRSLFSAVPLRRIPEDYVPPVVSLLELRIDGDVDGQRRESEEKEEEEDEAIVDYQTPEQLTMEMITMSMEPKSKWVNLLCLDTIKKRNKPKEAPKAPEKAPFFLPTLPGLEPKFSVDSQFSTINGDGLNSKIHRLGELRGETEFTRLLRASGGFKEPTLVYQFLNHLKSLSPSALDFELRSLDLAYNNLADLKGLLSALLFGLQSNKNFELYQSYLAVVLRIHGDIICSNMQEFHGLLNGLRLNQQASWLKLDSLFQQSLSIIDFIRGV